MKKQYENLICRKAKGIGWIKLNRREALNALSLEMIEGLYGTLMQWENDEEVKLICLEGEGEKAFCAGGDVRTLYDLRENGVEEYALKFFETEYCMNLLMHQYTKPILAYMNGYVMGGGVGISIGASIRIVSEKSKWSMPEMNIGLYPDVGGSYFLPKMPGFIGRYLALTSVIVKPEDILYIGAADYCIDSTDWLQLKEELKSVFTKEEPNMEQLEKILEGLNKPVENPSYIEQVRDKIDLHFSFDTMEEIIDSLESASQEGDAWAKQTKETLLEKSPTSLKVTLQQLINGKNSTIEECFAMEMSMSMSFMQGHDFFEGVRSVLVDKDRAPKWEPDKLEAVEMKKVYDYFSYAWKDGINPLEA